MKKFRVFVDMEKEEEYLNDMASQGLGLCKYSMWNRYTFEPITPQKRNYRIDYRVFNKKKDYINYLTLFEDSGWKQVSGSKSSGFHFFLPEDNQEQDSEIFSDAASSKERYKQLYKQTFAMGLLMFIYVVLFRDSFISIPTWYLAPSLWEYSGLQLLGMVVMETVFLLVQVFPVVCLLSFGIFFLVTGIKAKKMA